MRLRSIPRTLAWSFGGVNERFLQLPRPWRRLAPAGGIVVVVLGVDGSGKSSVTAAIRRWLGAEIDVLPMYFGTGDGRPSLLLLPLKLMVPLVMRLLGSKPKGASHGQISDRAPGPLYGTLLTIWASVLAVEKRSKLLAARRGVSRGMVVIGDRYPQDSIPSFNDGPLLPRLTYAPQQLRAFEAKAYALAARLPPDLVVKLVVTPAVLAVREPNMQLSVIEERVKQLRQLSHPGSKVICVDAEQPLAEVVRAIKREIWAML
jgi:thymidylate kinase